MSSEESRGTSRSDFLKQAAGATLVVAGTGAGAAAVVQQATAASGSPTADSFSLEIDGVNCGMLAGATGGDPEYDVVLDAVGPDNIQHKHLGQPKYEDFTIQVGSGMSPAVYQWITDSLAKGYARRSGAIVAADFKHDVRHIREFSQALLTSITIPALDGAAKTAPGSFTVTFSSPTVSDVQPSGQTVQAAKHKAWLCSNFKLVVDGVDTTRVASIDAFTWKQQIAEDGSVVLSAGDLGVSFDRASLPSWQKWYDDFAVGGDATDERSGTLKLVGQGSAVLNLGFSNLGLYRLAPDSGSDHIRRVKAEMYCEEIAVESWTGP